MPQHITNATAAWGPLTTSAVGGVLTVQMRGHGRLFVARGTETVPPAEGAGVFFESHGVDGAAGVTLQDLDPGGSGAWLWGRFEGFGACPVWASWEG